MLLKVEQMFVYYLLLLLMQTTDFSDEMYHR